ncbi:MAG: LuxR C-terminal-related transcriptional regulator [Pseudomonadota bacterium]
MPPASAVTGTRADALVSVMASVIADLGDRRFQQTVLDSVHAVLPAASWSVYRTGPLCKPVIYMSASHGVPDTTRDCWRAYLSGPYRSDRTLLRQAPSSTAASQISHITAQEVPAEHRARVYEAHGVSERVSIVEPQGEGSLFAINFYRHQHQPPFADAQIDALGQLAPALLALAHKHLDIRLPEVIEETRAEQLKRLTDRLHQLNTTLTRREAEVCAGILQGMSFDGIACEMALSVSTVKTYRNRAFDRLGIHFRNELFALMLESSQRTHAC